MTSARLDGGRAEGATLEALWLLCLRLATHCKDAAMS